MNEQLRLIGVTRGMTGTALMEKMMKGEVTTSDLSNTQIEQVLAAWDTRNFVPARHIGNVDVVKPIITKEDVINGHYTQEEYDRNYVEMIEKYLKTLW